MNRKIGQWNRIAHPETDLHIYENLIYEKRCHCSNSKERVVLSIQGNSSMGYPSVGNNIFTVPHTIYNNKLHVNCDIDVKGERVPCIFSEHIFLRRCSNNSQSTCTPAVKSE